MDGVYGLLALVPSHCVGVALLTYAKPLAAVFNTLFIKP